MVRGLRATRGRCGQRLQARGEEPSGVLAGVDVDPWACALGRLREHLRRARAWYALRVADPDLTVAALAHREGVAPARIREALILLELSPAIVGDLERSDRTGPVPTVVALEQLARYRQLCREAGTPGSKRQKGAARQSGFRHVLLRARKYQAWLDDWSYRSLREIAAAETVTAGRVGQVLDLVTLPTEVLAVLDVPAEQARDGPTHMELRRITRWAAGRRSSRRSRRGCRGQQGQ